MPKKRYSVWLDKELVKKAKKLAVEKEISFSKLIEEALKNYIEQQQKN